MFWRVSRRARRSAAVGAAAAALLSLPAAGAWAAGCEAGNVRWAGTSNRLYVSGADTVCTMAQLDALVPAAQITPMNAAQTAWLAGSNIVLDGGATLNIHGPAVEELRLKSNNTAGGIVYLRADWGTIDIRDTKITSWSEVAGGPDTEYGTWQRSYVQVRSRLGGDGTPLTSTMNVINSDVGYLGFAGAEAYGLSWKVNGAQPGLYDLVGVFGEVRGSRIHHNYFGMYTFGAEAMTWADNEIDHNVVYGLDPHDDSDRLVIERNDVHDNGSHGIICSQRCDHLTIRFNRSHHNGGNGIMLHRNVNDSAVEDNEVYDNTDSGLALFESHRNELRRNVATRNGKGVRLSVGSADNIVEDNTIADSAQYGIYSYKGSDAPTAGDGRPARNRFAGNVVRGSAVNGLKLTQSDENLFVGNEFTDNGKELRLEDARRNRFEDNSVTGNGLNYIYAVKQATATVVLVGEVPVAVRVGDSTSRLTIVDAAHRVLRSNRSAATTALPDRTELAVTRAVSSNVVTVTPSTLTVVPDSGVVTINLTAEGWRATASAGGMAVDYTVGGLTPGGTYDVLKNGAVIVNDAVANGSGAISFSNTLTNTNVATFEVR